LSEGISDAWAAPAARRSVARKVAQAEDLGDQVRPGSGEVVQLPGLAEAAHRLRERARPAPTGQPILTVEGLSIGFPGLHDGVDIVDDISFEVRPGEVLGLIGESGSGKSLTALA